MYKYKVLTEIEFMVLHSSLGGSKPLIMFETQLGLPTKADYLAGLFSLEKKGYIKLSDDQSNEFVVENDLLEMFAVMLKADSVTLASSIMEESPTLILYKCEDNIVIAAPGDSKREYVKLTKVSKQKAVRLLCDAYVSGLNDTIYAEKIPKPWLMEDESRTIITFRTEDCLTGSILNELAIVDDTLKYLLVIGSGDGQHFCVDYTLEGFISAMNSFLEGTNGFS